MPKPRLLVIEDDSALIEVLTFNLKKAGYDVSVARDGQSGLTLAQANPFDLIVLDLMLPVVDGIEVCRQLRSQSETRDVLVLILSAKSEEVDQIVGFSMGADDYVTKPFSVKVLLEHIKALLRRRQQSDTSETVTCQQVAIDRQRHRATLDGKLLDLTRTEFGLLDALIRQPGRAFSRAELIDAALGNDTIVLERTIDVHIRSVRQKLGEHASLVETVRGVGYRFRDPRDN